MNLLILKSQVPGAAEHVVHMGSSQVVFRRAAVDGRLALVADLSELTDPSEVLRKARLMPNLYEVVKAAPPPREVEVRPAPASTPPAEQSPPPTPVELARRNGWSYDDITGAGQGNQWGPEGGRSPRTGLTMGEMALSQPPPGWEAAAAAQYPWEVLGWTPPGVNFHPPAAPPKRILQPPEEEVGAPLADGPAVVDSPTVEQPREWASEVDKDDLTSYGTSEQQGRAVALIRTMIERNGGKPLSVTTVNYHLTKPANDLPKATAAQYRALVLAAQS